MGLTSRKGVHLWSILKLLMFAVLTYKYQSIYQQLFSLSMFLGFLMGTFLLELKLNHCLLLLFVSCCMCSYYIFWKNMGFLKNYVANMGQIAKKLGKSSIYGAALKLCSLLVTLQNGIRRYSLVHIMREAGFQYKEFFKKTAY